MPRRPRLAVAGIPWHIIQRGNNRSACFFSEQDYRYYLENLEEQSVKFGCAIHTYVLMTNHVHLLLTPTEIDSASSMMKNIGQRYTQNINRRYQRSGTLWEGRFKSCLAQDDSYALICYRYIELNPVRAGMVDHPGEYPWSSYRYNANGENSTLISPHESYQGLGVTQDKRQEAYRGVIRSHLDDRTLTDIRNSTNGNSILGNNKFKNEIRSILSRREK